MGTVHDKIVDTLEVGYILENKTIRTPPVFPILTSPPPPKPSQLLCCFVPESGAKGEEKHEQSLAKFHAD